MTDDKRYEVNFFKPLSEHAKANKKLILTLAIIWAVAVFGFQFALILLNEPTPEKNYTLFQSVWPEVVENESASTEIKQDFIKVSLAVLGKNIAVSEDHKTVLKGTLSRMLLGMQPDSLKPVFQKEPDQETYALAAETIGLASTGFEKIMIDLLPTSLVQVNDEKIPAEYKEKVPSIMELYLVHNQNILTDIKFLGFPFHYWYTAQFLLILFVVLCVIYAVAIEKRNIKHDFIEET